MAKTHVAIYVTETGPPMVGISIGDAPICWMTTDESREVAGNILDAAVKVGGFPT